MLFAKRTIEGLKSVFKYNGGQKMPELEKMDPNKMEKIRTYFDLLCRNKSYVEQFLTVFRATLGSFALKRYNLELILTDKPSSECFYTLNSRETEIDLYRKKTFTSLSEIGVPESIPRSSRFMRKENRSFNDNSDYPFKDSWIEEIDMEYEEFPYEGWAGYAIEKGEKIAERYESLAKQSSSLTQKIRAMWHQKQSHKDNVKCQIVQHIRNGSFSLVWIEEAIKGGMFSRSFVHCGSVKVRRYRYSEYHANSLFGRIAGQFANFLAGYLIAFEEMADKLQVRQNTDSEIA